MKQITINKDLKDHWIFQNEKYFKWWMIVLMEVNDEDTVYLHRYELLKVKKGQIMKTFKNWGELFNCHERTVKKFFHLLEENDMICIVKNTKRALQPTLIEIRLSGCFFQERALQGAAQSAVQKAPEKSTKKEPIPEPFTELDDSFKLEQPKPKKKPAAKASKSPTKTYSKCIGVYNEFYKCRNNGVPPDINGVVGGKMKLLIKYMEKTAVAKNPTLKEDETLLSDSIVNGFKYIFVNWDRLEPFYQSKISLSQIQSNISVIIDQINNNGKSTKPTKSERTASAREKMLNYQFSEEGNTNGF